MMTLEQLRVIANETELKTTAVYEASNKLNIFMRQIVNMLSEQNPYAEAINVDEFVAIQTPLFNALVAELTAAYNELVP